MHIRPRLPVSCLAVLGAAAFLSPCAPVSADSSSPLQGLPNVIFATTDNNGVGTVGTLNNDSTARTLAGGLGSESTISSSLDGNFFLLTINSGTSTTGYFGPDGLYRLTLATGAITPWTTFDSGDVLAIAAAKNGAFVYALSLSGGIIAVDAASRSQTTLVAASQIPFSASNMTADPLGNFYVTGNTNSGNEAIGMLTPDTSSGTLTYTASVLEVGNEAVVSLAAAPDGSGVYYCDVNGDVHFVAADGSGDQTVLHTEALQLFPSALATDPAGSVYFGGASYQYGTETSTVSVIYRLEIANQALYALTPKGVSGMLTSLTLNGNTSGGVAQPLPTEYPAFFDGQIALSGGEAYYLSFPNGNYFGFYSFLSDPSYIYHYDLGYEFVENAGDADAGVYLYDFTSDHWLYTSPLFPFPYLYDFSLQSVLYYFPDPDTTNDAGHYNTDGVRYFYQFSTGQIITL